MEDVMKPVPVVISRIIVYDITCLYIIYQHFCAKAGVRFDRIERNCECSWQLLLVTEFSVKKLIFSGHGLLVESDFTAFKLSISFVSFIFSDISVLSVESIAISCVFLL